MESTIVYWGYIFSLLSGPVNSVYQLDLNEQVSCDPCVNSMRDRKCDFRTQN